MKNPEVHYVRLTLESFNDHFRVEDSKYETDPRLWDVLDEPFLMEPLTQSVVDANPSVFSAWKTYREEMTTLARLDVKKINAVGMFEIDKSGEVRLLDIAFA